VKRLFAVALIAACGAPSGSAVVAPLPTPVAPAPKPAKPSLVWPVAHWVPRIAPASFEYGGSVDFYGPIRNNFGTKATVYLGNQRAGVIGEGGRAIWEAGKLGAIQDKGRSLATVMAVDPSLGGGFVFTGDEGILWGATFDGPLKKLSGAPQAFNGSVAPHAVLCGTWLVSTADALPIPTAPRDVTNVWAHGRLGFAIAATPTGAFVSSDGRKWKPLGMEVRRAVEDGAELVAFGMHNNDAVRVAADGKVVPLKLTDEERIALELRITDRRTPDDAFEGWLLDGGWQPTGRSADEWFVVKGREIAVTHTPSGVIQKVGTAAGDSCAAITLERPLIICQAGSRWTVSHVDLATGALDVEQSRPIKNGGGHIILAPGVFPPAVMVDSDCGSGADGWCVRDDVGAWHDVPKATTGQILPFPGELLTLVVGANGAIELHGPGAAVHVFAGAQMDRLKQDLDGMGSAGAFRTGSGVDMAYVPDPTKPLVKHESTMVHVPLDPGQPLALSRVSGIVATAGAHALRLDGDKLYETNDGWATWYEVPPPPTGPLHDLAGAMCDVAGCRIGSWARLGWARP
jgi:hypothetical protein